MLPRVPKRVMTVSGYAARLDSLAESWREWARIGAELSEPEWRRPTRCESWQVAHLYAHHSGFPVALAAPALADGTTAPVSAAEVLRGFNSFGGIAHAHAPAIAQRAVKVSIERPTHELVERFAVTGARTIAALRIADPPQPVQWAGHVVTLAELLRIGLLEATVHLLDLQRALEREPRVPDGALRETALLLAEVAPAVQFIESATGRTPAAPPLPVIR